MANRNQPLDQSILDFVQALPAAVFAQVRKEVSGRYSAFLDLGPKTYVSDASPGGCGGATPLDACEALKAWLLDDLSCGGRLGKRRYQPHWDGYDTRYRLGEHWLAKQARLAANPVGFDMLSDAEPRTQPALPRYEGWANSATYLAKLYMAQEPVLHTRIVQLAKSGQLNVRSLKALAPVKVNHDEDAPCGYQAGKLCLDSWANGAIDWRELVANWKSELRSVA